MNQTPSMRQLYQYGQQGYPQQLQQYGSPKAVIPSFQQTAQTQQLQTQLNERQQNIQGNRADVHHFERPLQVVPQEDIEQKWKEKCLRLEMHVYELQVEIQRLRLQNSSGQITYIQDDTRINELMQANKEIRNQEQQMRIQNKQLLEDLESWKSRYKLLQESNSKSSGLDEEIRQLKKKINELSEDLAGSHEQIQQRDNEILNLKQLLHDKDNELDQLDARIRELEMMCENYSQSETQIISLQGEVELWKKKFKQVNEQNSDLAEKLTMAETQLEAIKKRQVTVTKETEVRKSGTHGGGTTSTYEQNVIKGAQLLHPRGSQYLK
ncbi:unnamed protein product [Paramecium pentaurelia]|uniref:Uncharacterized protein n=1 Tax=Paramecium pentaurelia TaxID=43138 RepID=A0A8S1TID3_9CILI|nr:unnamed protein product [Paramecium pentaurelia]